MSSMRPSVLVIIHIGCCIGNSLVIMQNSFMEAVLLLNLYLQKAITIWYKESSH